MKHYTSKEKTGKTVQEIKLSKVLEQLKLDIVLADSVFDKTDIPKDKRVYKIDRQELTDYIIKALKCMSRNTVYGMINYLIANGYIERNSTTQLSSKKRLKMPTNNTKYKLNEEKIWKGKRAHTLIIDESSHLDSYLKP
jgi:hypothetical protein